MTPVDMIIDALERNGQQVKRSGDKIMAQCPAHPDRSPSLTITAGSKRDVALHCFAGCDPTAIMAAIGLKWTDLSPTKPRREVIKEYIYELADGSPSFKVTRFDDKSFMQSRAVGSGFTSGLGDAERVIYRLPEIRCGIDKGESIWVAEGEKDVDNIRRHWGLYATCNAGGANNWKPSHAAYLRGATMVNIIADNDTAGFAHARTVAESLAAIGVPTRTFKALKGKDASDHIAAGLSVEQLVEIDLTEPPPEPEAPSDNLPIPVDWASFWSLDASEDEWLVEPFLPKGRMAALYAPAKAGKSLLALEVAVAVATGRAVLNQPAREPRHVCYFDLEMTQADLQERLIGMGYSEHDDLSHFHYFLMPSLSPLDTRQGGEEVRSIVAKHGAELAVFDTMARVVAGKENDADTYRGFYNNTVLPLKAQGITILRLDHAGKDLDKGQRGSSEKNGDVDVVWQMVVNDDGVVTLKATHRRVGWVPAELRLDRVEDPNITHRIGVGDAYPAGTADCVAALDELNVPVDASANACQKALKEAKKGVRRQVVLAARRFRNARNTQSLDCLGTDPSHARTDQVRNPPGTAGTSQGVTEVVGFTDVVRNQHRDREPQNDWKARLDRKNTNGARPAESPVPTSMPDVGNF